jgi:hypothetical protein
MISPNSTLHTEFCNVSPMDSLKESDSAPHLVDGKSKGKEVALNIHLITKDFLTSILCPASADYKWPYLLR